MSFILDALKKSESERQRRSAPGIADVPESSRPGNAPRWIWVLAALLAINAAVLAGLWLKPGSESAVAEPDAVPAPAAATGPDSFSGMVSAARDAAARRGEPATSATAPPDTEPALTKAGAGDAADPAGSPGAQPGPAATGAKASMPASTATPPPGDAEPLATFDELRARGALSLPALHLDIHVYSEKPGDRFVFVNMNKYREQGKLAEGPLVKEISPDGVVLEHQGTEFLLPRK